MPRLLKPEVVRAGLPVILVLQETRSWTANELHLLGLVENGNEFGLASILISYCLSSVQKSWRRESCTAVLVGFSMVMSVCAPDSGKDLEEYKKFLEEVTHFLRVGWRNWAQHFSIAGDFNIDLGLLCIDEETDEGARGFLWSTVLARVRG